MYQSISFWIFGAIVCFMVYAIYQIAMPIVVNSGILVIVGY